MRRPWFPFYSADWQSNANLRRCSHAERGAWIDILCLMHDSAEYGVLRWALREIADAIGCRPTLLRQLAAKAVIKGADPGRLIDPPLIFIPVSGRRPGPPITLLEIQPGPLWYSSRMVVDEYKRQHRSKNMDADPGPESPPKPSPKGGFGEGFDVHHSRAEASEVRSQRSEKTPPVAVAVVGDLREDLHRGQAGPVQPRTALTDVFALWPGWEPGAEFPMRLRYANLPMPEPVWRAELPEFVLFREARGELKTQAEWEHKFVQDLKFRAARRAQTGAEPVEIPPNWGPAVEARTILAARGVALSFADQLIAEFVLAAGESGRLSRSWNSEFVEFVCLRWARSQETPSGTFEQLTDRAWAEGLVPDPIRRLE